GFTPAEDAWLPLDPRHRALAVDAQENDANSVLAFARKMIALRKQSAALREGAFRAIDTGNALLVFERATPGARVLCAFNLSATPQRFPWSGTTDPLLALGGAAVEKTTAHLPAYSALLFAV